MLREKIRMRFRKTGAMRLVSHHDLMRCFERMLRRAALPFHATQGFHPKPRLVFALSLPLGIIGAEEVVDLELDAEIPPEEIRARLARQAPSGLEILTVERIATKCGAQARRVSYRLALPPERAADVPARAAALLALPECWIERTRPQARRINLRSYLLDLRAGADALDMDLLVTPKGTARPDEVLAALGLDDLLDSGAVLERTRLVLHEDEPQTEQVQGNV